MYFFRGGNLIDINALIAALGSLVGTVVGILANSKLMIYRIGQLEEKVNKHNNLVERMYNLEKSNELQDEKIKVINHRIGDLEKEV